ncbi:hypothetical protein GCM10009602_03670 [Nocardiopsis tropica]
MGAVCAALDDDRPVAVGRVHRPFAADAEFRARFAREVAPVRRAPARVPPGPWASATRPAGSP